MATPTLITSKADLLESVDLAPSRELVTIQAWNKQVWMRQLTEDEAQRIGILAEDKSSSRQLRAKAAALVLVDEAGNRLLKDEDAAALAKRSFRAIREIWAHIQRMNALTAEGRAELGKDSAATSAAASSSD